MIPIEYFLLVGSVLVLLSIGIAKLSDNLGVPVLLLFLILGMLAGSEGIGGIYFDNAGLAQSIGIVALIFILFAGGLDTKWSEVRPVVWQAAGLSIAGVFITALAVGLFATWLLGFSFLEGLLLGAVVSSTDAAAVFAVLRSRKISLKGNLKPLLELESGSNDPMAVFLTVGTIQLITLPRTSIAEVMLQFFLQMGIGALLGLTLGRAMVFVLNWLKISHEGIYPVLVLAFATFVYGTTATLGGSGFLAVYICGLVAGRAEFVQKKSLLRFFDGLAWLSQIGMFLTLGLLVYPSQVFSVVGAGLLVSGFLMFVARPLSVFSMLSFAQSPWRDKAFVSWVGLRGAVPIILATFPLIAGLPKAGMLFNLVFFIVLTSGLLQGWSVPYVARLLKVDAPLRQKRKYPIEFAPMDGMNAELVDFMVPHNSTAVGKSLVELSFPQDTLVVLISRDDGYVVPSGGTILQEGDTILVLSSEEYLPEIRARLSKPKTRE
ncbi:MAG: potassium/proton antiporter [Bacteroidetes bacterium]|nr:potassium/proton antiporter [Bacteroidota bacterium]